MAMLVMGVGGAAAHRGRATSLDAHGKRQPKTTVSTV